MVRLAAYSGAEWLNNALKTLEKKRIKSEPYTEHFRPLNIEEERCLGTCYERERVSEQFPSVVMPALEVRVSYQCDKFGTTLCLLIVGGNLFTGVSRLNLTADSFNKRKGQALAFYRAVTSKTPACISDLLCTSKTEPLDKERDPRVDHTFADRSKTVHQLSDLQRDARRWRKFSQSTFSSDNVKMDILRSIFNPQRSGSLETLIDSLPEKGE